jgi:hypothetical protein
MGLGTAGLGMARHRRPSLSVEVWLFATGDRENSGLLIDGYSTNRTTRFHTTARHNCARRSGCSNYHTAVRHARDRDDGCH